MSLAVRQFMLGLISGLTVAFIFVSFPLLSLETIRPQAVQLAYDIYKNMAQQAAENVQLLNDTHIHHDDDRVAKELYKKVRVLIWIMTSPQNLEKKAYMVKRTWASRANKVIFFSSVDNKSFPAVGLGVAEGREHLTAKTMKGFRYIFERHFNDADWFMKADDDTYVIVENLRYFLSDKNTSEPVFFGFNFNNTLKQGFYSGGAGYVLSKEALKRFGEKANSSICRQDGGYEDVELSRCMEHLGVKTANSIDSLGRNKFYFHNPEHFLGGYRKDANEAKKAVESISDYAISFHYVTPKQMLSLEYYTYHLRPYGINYGK